MKTKIDRYYGELDLNNDIESECLINNYNDNSKPTISICIPTCNRYDLLKEAVDSIYDNIDSIEGYEVIIADNNDSKNDEYLKYKDYKNLKYYRNTKNLGMYGNWNRLIKLANADYIAYLHDDDLLSKEYFKYIKDILRKCIEASNDNLGLIKIEPKSIYGELKPEDKINNTKRLVLREMKMIDSVVNGRTFGAPPTCGLIFSKKALIDVGGFSSKYKVVADQMGAISILEKGYKEYRTNIPLSYYRWGVNVSLKEDIPYQTDDEMFEEAIYI